MRSKEVDEAIESLKEHTKTYLDEFTTDFQDDFMGKVEIVLSYISKLEDDFKNINILIGRGSGKTSPIVKALQEIEENTVPKDKIKEIIDNYYPDVAIVKLNELLEGVSYE